MRRTFKTVAIAVAAALVFAVLTSWASWAQEKNWANQLDDFRVDVATVGFAINPQWVEKTKNGRTVTVMEATILITGCKVKLERAKDERQVAGTLGGRKIENYTVGGVNIGSREIKIDDYPGFMARPSDIGKFLSEHGKKRFPCLDSLNLIRTWDR